MTRLVWAFGWVGVAIWSLFCALAYGLFDLVGKGFMRNADAFSNSPEAVESLWKFFSFLHSFSTGAVLVIWAFVSLMILAVPWAIDRMVGPPRYRGAVPPQVHPQAPDPRFDRRGDVIDLAPDQYSVGPDGARGAPPRLPPRP